MNKKYCFIDILKVVACILITNSHCSELYPMPLMAFGGSQGNTLFFIVSGFCLGNIHLELIPWLKRRYARLFLPVVIVIALFSIGAAIAAHDGGHLFSLGLMGILDRYWFVFAIAIYYPILYASCKNQRVLTVVATLTMLLYVALSAVMIIVFNADVEPAGFRLPKIVFYLLPFLAGAMLARNANTLEALSQRPLSVLIAGFFGSLALWAALYLLSHQAPMFALAQILLGVCNLSMGVFAILLGIKCESGCSAVLEAHPRLQSVVRWIASSTLEIYLVQVSMGSSFASVTPFPLSVLLFFITVFVIGIILHRAFSLMD